MEPRHKVVADGILKSFGFDTDLIKADKPDGHWVTSEETGKHIFIGADGKANYTREQIEGGSGSLGGVADEPSEDKFKVKTSQGEHDLRWHNNQAKEETKKDVERNKNFTDAERKLHNLENSYKVEKDYLNKLLKEAKDKKDDEYFSYYERKLGDSYVKFNELISEAKNKVKEEKSESRDNNFFEKEHGVSIEKLVKEIENPDYDNRDTSSAFERAGGKTSDNNDFKTDLNEDIINALNKNDIKLNKKIYLTGREVVESTNKPAPKINKTGLASLDRIVNKDDLRPNQMGVFVDGDKLVATDGNKMVILNNKDPELKKRDGQIIDVKTGNEISKDRRFPDYKAAVPKYSEYTSIPIEKLLDHVNGTIDAFKNVKSSYSPTLNLKIGDENLYLNSKLAFDTLQALRSNGSKNIKVGWGGGMKGFHIIGDNGDEGLVMPQNGFGSFGSTKEFKIT